MGLLDSTSLIKIITISTLLLLFFLSISLYFTTSPWSTSLTNHTAPTPGTFFKTQPEQPQASQALLVPETNRSSSITKKKAAPTRKHVGPVEESLGRARAAIRRADANYSACFGHDTEDQLRIYRNPNTFCRSYLEMERRMKVYVYEEGDVPLFHDGPLKNIYSIEGRFIHELEGTRGGLRTTDPSRANVFFLPLSVAWMVKYVYDATTRDMNTIRQVIGGYVGLLSMKYPYWNRTAGADHFMLSCHDWALYASTATADLAGNAIRGLCNANTSDGFIPRKDVSIPEIHLLTGDIPLPLLSPPPPTSPLPYLAFFAGGQHGPIRPILLRHWRDKDPAIQVHEYLPQGVDYFNDYLLRSRFCLCPSGYEVASPRVVEGILGGCVPVLISEGYYPPFSDVLRWEEFSVRVEVGEIARLKEILEGIGDGEVERLREGLKRVRRHFVLNRPARRFDVFHMIMHSVWLRRLNVMS